MFLLAVRIHKEIQRLGAEEAPDRLMGGVDREFVLADGGRAPEAPPERATT
jgi:hypothetical protein